MPHSKILFFHPGCGVVTVSKYSTSGTSLPSRFGSLFYELSSSEVRVSLACEINRLLVSVYTWVRLIYIPPVKRDIKISFSYSSLSTSQAAQPISPQIWLGVMGCRSDAWGPEEDAGQGRIYKKAHVRFEFPVCVWVSFLVIFSFWLCKICYIALLTSCTVHLCQPFKLCGILAPKYFSNRAAVAESREKYIMYWDTQQHTSTHTWTHISVLTPISNYPVW